MQYYRFLTVLADDRSRLVRRCEYCGKLFAPVSQNNTKYCDRLHPNGRTCQDLGPAARHRIESGKDPVLETFYRVKRRMSKRAERFLDGMCTPPQP